MGVGRAPRPDRHLKAAFVDVDQVLVEVDRPHRRLDAKLGELLGGVFGGGRPVGVLAGHGELVLHPLAGVGHPDAV